MKFDRMVKYITEGHLGIPKGLNVKTRPDQALKALSDAYEYIIGYNVDSYNNLDTIGVISKNQEIGDKLNVILYVLSESGLNQFEVGGDTLDRDTIIKNVLNKMGHFQVSDKPPFTVPSSLKGDVHDVYNNPIRPGTVLHSGDYRLSMLQNTREIRKYGGVAIWHEIYKKLLPLVGLQHQVYRRREESQMAEENVQQFVVYYYGQNFLPYRTVLKANKEGKIITHSRHIPGTAGDVDPTKGHAFWRTDRMFNKYEKPTPLAFVNRQTGSYDGRLMTDDKGIPLDAKAIRRELIRIDFEEMTKELDGINALSDRERKRMYDQQQNLIHASRDEKIRHYDELMEMYENARTLKGRKRQPLEYDPAKDFFYPFFTTFEVREGDYIPIAASAQTKFKQIWNQEQFPELYTDR